MYQPIRSLSRSISFSYSLTLSWRASILACFCASSRLWRPLTRSVSSSVFSWMTSQSLWKVMCYTFRLEVWSKWCVILFVWRYWNIWEKIVFWEENSWSGVIRASLVTHEQLDLILTKSDDISLCLTYSLKAAPSGVAKTAGVGVCSVTGRRSLEISWIEGALVRPSAVEGPESGGFVVLESGRYQISQYVELNSIRVAGWI